MTFSTQKREAKMANARAQKGRDEQFRNEMAEQRAARRNHMVAFKLNEISFVDRPAQEHAVAVLMKRADEPKRVIATTVRKLDADGNVTHTYDYGIDNAPELLEQAEVAKVVTVTAPAPKPATAPASFNEAVALFKSRGLDPVKAMQRAADRYPDLLKRYQGGEQPAPMVQPSSFNEAVDSIAKRDDVNRMKAMQSAAREFPDLLKAYQREGAVSSRPVYEKRGPSRAMQEFNLLVDGIAAREKCTRDAAMSRARREHPAAFAAAYE